VGLRPKATREAETYLVAVGTTSDKKAPKLKVITVNREV